MPELPEVEVVRRALQHGVGRFLIRHVEVRLERTVASPVGDCAAFAAALTECRLTSWRRRGKYLLSQLVRQGRPAGRLGVHLRMTGRFRWLNGEDSPLCPHTRVRFLGDGKELRFVDTRSFGRMWWVPPGTAASQVITGLQRLGPEPFAAAFDGAYLEKRLRGSRRPIKTALLDQSVVAGVGNIYADECLFLAGIPPHVASNSLSQGQLHRLCGQLVRVLARSIQQGGTSFRDFRDLQGVNGNYGQQAWVYGRPDAPCRRCGAPIQRQVLGGRSSHWCPHCQQEGR
ncbi:MAG: DNA-formamidopyrimidine glycosylase [Synechococcus sp. SB0662_bin_45]|uniref:Formamidopyrimidine-DNA glycosylase n=1 Tax=Synechococcus sp. SB0676_bin_10 TaxID=2604869 RepID=A0A6B1F636_9SYNE|nr:DNA-formamidopyrimidine glycosylase [Cyanobacteria bacterium MAG IRC3_bin_20]MCY3654775.1 DNA-formamidopyrimidine glycosylase [Cyanobacteria bacterium MAG IRC1_bin_28]MDE0647529.1 DNA-formamidopyrimidine glycosylase [Cyanobacteria bacterium MAG IRC4_bin_6]MXW13136.1 DNA-formamidopyrimidine glycosylase [Synechococcus sp. SB0668_bin_13]MXY18753.1 DNA-formamidopyrimidine glycosylase [Synechococcus sp. SB0664_bin_36]MYE22193.1 DNA-formamidopyrimidine glycosylase [Synechococcus sp. SB0662_bin_45